MTSNIVNLQEFREKNRKCHISKFGLNDEVRFRESEDSEFMDGYILQVCFSDSLILYTIQGLDDDAGMCYIYECISENLVKDLLTNEKN